MEKKHDKVALYVGGDIGEKGTAMAIHCRNFSRILTALGYQVEFICGTESDASKHFADDPMYSYTYVSRNSCTIPKVSVLESLYEILTGHKIVSAVKQYAAIQKPDLIIFYGSSGEKRLLKFCKKERIPLYIDRVDWFEKEDRGKSIGDVCAQYISDMSVQKYDLEANGVVSISPFFYRYFTEKNQKTIWVPPVFMLNEKKDFSKNQRLTFSYAGSLGGKKDTISPVVEAALKLNNPEQVLFNLNLVGISESDLTNRFGQFPWKELGISAFGRLPHSTTLEILKDSDFCVLLRQNKRYAKAGFSTKFAESMSLGVPLLCTAVGGADVLIENGKNGFIVNDNEAATIQNAVLAISQLSDEELEKMKRNAYETAKKYFSYKGYMQPFAQFLKETI